MSPMACWHASLQNKLRVVRTVTLAMGIGLALMGKVPVGHIILAVVRTCYLLYFFRRIQTAPKGQVRKDEQDSACSLSRML